MSELDELIRQRIESPVGLTVEQFIDLALYHPDHGFYCRGGSAGRRGDFITSPEVGPLFGAVLARMLDAQWRDLGEPATFVVIEAAAGVGTLARGIRAAAPDCWPSVRYLAVERSSELRGQHPDWVESLSDLPDEPGLQGVIIANELLDNLAFGLSAADVELRVPDPIPESGVRPVQTQAREWVARAINTLAAGHVIVFDYCSTTADLFARPWTEWLRTYRGHDRGSHPFEDPGSQDITVDVCVDQLPSGFVASSQADFLRRWGIDEMVDEGRRVWTERAHLGDLAALRARSRIRESEALLDQQGLGAFTVLQWTAGGTPS